MPQEELIAVITRNKEAVGGDVPVFYAESEDELERVAGILSQVLKAMVHDLGNGVFVLVKH